MSEKKFNTFVNNHALRILYWSCCVIISMIAFEMLAINAAMPKVVMILHRPDLFSLSFGVALAGQIITTVISGVWCDRRGPRPSIFLGVTLFSLGLFISGFAPNMYLVVVGRLAQGLGGGICVVPLYVIIGEAVPQKIQPKFFAAFATAWVIPSLIGPVIAGFFVDHGFWRLIFLIVPFFIGISIIIVVPFLIHLPLRSGPASNSDHSVIRPLPYIIAGALVVGIGLGIIYIYGSDSSPITGPARLGVVVPIAVLIIGVIPFLLPPRTLRFGRGLPSTIMSRVFINGAFVASEIYLPYFLHQQGWSSTKGGLVLTVSSLTWAIGSVAQGRVTNKEIRAAIPVAGCTLGVAGCVLTALATTPLFPAWVVFPAWCMVGLGVGAAFPALTVFALALAEKGRSGEVSSAIQIADVLGSAVGIALTSSIASAFGGYWAITVPIIVASSILLLATFICVRASKGIVIPENSSCLLPAID